MKVMLVILKILFIGGLLIISNGELALSESENIEIFMDEYAVWVSGLFENGLTIVGYVVNTEWLPDANTTYADQG